MRTRAKIILVFLCTLNVQFSYSQVIPDWRRIDWSIAGYEGEIPCYTNLRNAVVEFGIDNTGATDVSSIVNAAITTLQKGEVLYFPNGTYLFKSTVKMKSNAVIRGESVQGTLFQFTFTQDLDCFSFKGTATANVTTVTDPKTKGAFSVVVASTSGLAVNQLIELEQDNDTAIHFSYRAFGDRLWNSQDWSNYLKGQLLEITAIDNNTKTITFDRPLSIDYDRKFNIRINTLLPIEQAGVENLHMIRTDKTGGYNNNNVMMIYARNCWVKGIHSEFTARYQMRIDHSTNIEIRDSYIENAYYWGAGGAAYGVMCADHTCQTLVENNIFRLLRHAIIVKEGANSNVYAYNYVLQGKWDGNDFPADISLHGHYAYENLFEGNIVRRGAISDAWGPTGPGNTIFRNRFDGHKNLWIQDHSDYQNLMANEFTFNGTKNKNPGIENDHDYSGVKGIIRYENVNIKGIDTLATTSVPSSYYLTEKPAFFGSKPWPSMGTGNAMGSGSIPAFDRWLADSLNPMPQWQNCVSVSVLNSKIKGINIYPNPSQNTFVVFNENQLLAKVEVYNSIGQLIEKHETTENIVFGENFTPGAYWVKVQQNNQGYAYKLIKL